MFFIFINDDDDDDDDRELKQLRRQLLQKRPTRKVNSCCLKLHRAYSISFNSSTVGKFFLSGIQKSYRKIPKISPGAYIFQSHFLRGLCTERNLRFKTDWASLLWEGNLPFLLCFTLYSRANSKNKLPGGLIFEGAI